MLKKLPIKRFEEIYYLTSRLFIQLRRKPIILISGLIQPLLWLILFGCLFQNLLLPFKETSVSYFQFFAPGIIIFTTFSGALNAGLPLIFDKEFGFFNRLLVAPLISRFSIVFSATFFIVATTLLQTIIIIFTTSFFGAKILNLIDLVFILFIASLLIIGITTLSICLAFSLPSHIEFLAVILILNLPLLFTSTALAPLNLMPTWLQCITLLNPLSYAIEMIRHIYLHSVWNFNDHLLDIFYFSIDMKQSLFVLFLFDVIIIYITQIILKKFLA
uniref:ABC transmembrane type-2 domain-containing protein n=1 Tax=Cyanoptyche gloeocystis TaxID=77922 RepID=A0A3G1IWL1_9EUKA|nr:hypothetical protein [Cyanoptyche gloeocystis]